MRAQIRVDGADRIREFAQLTRFLQSQRELGGAVQPIRGELVDGDLGGAFDVLAVALGSSGAGVALSRALTVWIENLRSDVKVTITWGERSVELDAKRVEDVPGLLREVMSATGDD